MALTGLVVDIMTPRQYGHILSGMPLMGRDVVDAPMLVLMVVPGHEGQHPVARCFQAGKAGLGEVRNVLAGSEQRLDKGIVVADPRPAEQGRDTELAQHHLNRLTLDHAAIVTMQYERLANAAFLPHPYGQCFHLRWFHIMSTPSSLFVLR